MSDESRGLIPVGQIPALDWRAWSTPFLFFTGKGGVGKTTIASAVAVALSDAGRRVLLVSTDPASNLADVLGTQVGPERQPVPGVAGLEVMNVDPDAAADAYRDRVLAPYRGVVPEAEVRAIEEQLAGECTVEVAAFDEFTRLIVDPNVAARHDHILFDTAPTGHTLRLLNLPSAWSHYLQSSPAGASCLGPRSGLQAQRSQYEAAVRRLADPAATTLVLVTRPDRGALREASRAGAELAQQGIHNEQLVVNGLLTEPLGGDIVAEALARQQHQALQAMPATLRTIPTTAVPLVALNLTGVESLRALVANRTRVETGSQLEEPVEPELAGLDALVRELADGDPTAVLVMGKGGVGKTTIAAAIAVGLAHRGREVHLSTTDPAGRLTDVLADDTVEHLTISRIDPARELAAYTEERLRSTRGLDPERRALLEEDLRSPCTEELAVFRAFSALLSQARKRFVILDTAPSGHTLRLLDLTGSYHRQIIRDTEQLHGRVTTPLMRLQDSTYTRVLIVTLPELTPVSEAAALQDDLRRAGIEPFGWVVNAALTGSGTRDPVLRARAKLEHPQLQRIETDLAHRVWLVPWQLDIVAGSASLNTLASA